MGVYRIPVGWTQEQADAVWQTWERAFKGAQRPEFRCPNIPPYDPEGAGLDRYFAELEIAKGPFSLPPGMSWGYAGGGYCVIHFADDQAKLRAWAAVGAPVIPPHEGGDVLDLLGGKRRVNLTPDLTCQILRRMADEAQSGDIGFSDEESPDAARVLRHAATLIAGPPREEGEPAPLWEWVRACEESAMGPRMASAASRGIYFSLDEECDVFAVPVLHEYSRRTKSWRLFRCGIIQGDFTTPAELRAALDALAKEAP